MRILRMERKTLWKVAGVSWGVAMVMVLIIVLIPKSEGLPPQAVEKSADLANIANHSGKFVVWYVDQITPLCEESYGKGYCTPVVMHLTKTETELCGVMPDGQIEWPTSLADGEFYYVEMHFIGGGTGYGQISAGARHNEIPDQETVFRCWDRFGILR